MCKDLRTQPCHRVKPVHKDGCDFINWFCACTEPGFDTTRNIGPNLGALKIFWKRKQADRVEIQSCDKVALNHYIIKQPQIAR